VLVTPDETKVSVMRMFSSPAKPDQGVCGCVGINNC
jgi:hypothetical protein